jgi:hypothetical protein
VILRLCHEDKNAKGTRLLRNKAGAIHGFAIKSSKLERFSNSCGVFEIVQGGFFLRKKPLGDWASPLYQLENRYSPRCAGLASEQVGGFARLIPTALG